MIYNAGRGKQGKFKLKYVLGQEVIQFIYFLYCLCREILPMNRSLVHSGASQGTKCSQILHRALGAPTGDEQQGNGVCLCVTLPPSLESEPLITIRELRPHEHSQGSFPSRCAKNPQRFAQQGLWTGETPGRLGTSENSSSSRNDPTCTSQSLAGNDNTINGSTPSVSLPVTRWINNKISL